MLPSRFANIEAFFKQRPLVVALGCGCLAVICMMSFLANREAELLRLGQMLTVFRVAQDLPAGTLVGPDVVRRDEIPRRWAEPNTLVDPNLLGHLVNRVALPKGALLTASTVVTLGSEGGLAAKIPAGKRAVTMAVDEVNGVAGLIRPDDRVDVLATFDFGSEAASRLSTVTLFEAVPVLAVGSEAIGETVRRAQKSAKYQGLFSGGSESLTTAARRPTVTVALAPHDAQRAIFAQEAGTIALVLRTASDEEKSSLVPATMRDVVGNDELVRGRRTTYREYRGR